MKFCYLLLLVVMLFFYGCSYKQKEEQIERKEAELNQKEQELILKEKTLAIKEEELLKKQSKMDSSFNNNSPYIDTLTGNWNVQMTCTQTTCPGFAVGDTKTEQWNISYEANHIIAKAMNGDKLSRIYSGIYTGNTVELVEEREGTTAQPATKMTIRLQLKEGTSMQGQREIVRENGCRVLYSLQLDKRSS